MSIATATPATVQSALPARKRLISCCVGAAALFALAAQVSAQPALGTLEDFGILAASAITNSGTTIIVDGNLGISPSNASSVTGFPPGIVQGTTHFADPVAQLAQDDLTAAYLELAGMACGTTVSADLGGTTLAPGVYCAGSSMGLTGTLTLDAQGDPDALFVFQMGTTLTTASSSAVVMINGAQACNVYWKVGSSATLGTGTDLVGSILAQDSITLTTGANTSGRLLSRTGAITLDTNVVSVCDLAATSLSLAKRFTPSTINFNGLSTLTMTLRNPDLSIATLTSDLVDNLPAGVVIANVPNVITTCGGNGEPIALAGSTSVTLPAGRTIPAAGNCTLSVAVTSAQTGSYLNTLPIGALSTSNGDNLAPATATLVVVANAAPSLSKAFNPASIVAGATSRLTVTLVNPDPAVATLMTNLVDVLPTGVVIANLPDVSTTCGGTGTPIANPGASLVTLPAGRTIPANGSCTLSASVTAALPGSYLNRLPIGALMTSNGNNPAPATATLTVRAFVAAPTMIPTLSTWALLLSVGLVMLLGAVMIRRG